MRAVIVVEADRERIEVHFERLTEAIIEGGGRLESGESVESYWLTRVREAAIAASSAVGAGYEGLTIRLEVDGEEVPIR